MVMNFSGIAHTFLPATGSQAMNSPQLPPGAGVALHLHAVVGRARRCSDCGWSVRSMQMLKMPA